MAIDEFEFHRILAHFPVVRPRDYCLDVDSAGQSTSRSMENKEVHERRDRGKKDSNNHPTDIHDAFWDKLKSSAEKKVGSTEAEKFCKAFQQIYKKLVYEELSLDAAQSFIKSFGYHKN